MIEVTNELERTMVVSATPEQAFALVCSIPDSSAHFPGVESVTPEAGGWTWKLEKAGVGSISLQAVYGCRYTPDAAARTLAWAPVEGVGNTRVSGSWRIGLGPGGTRLEFKNRAVLSLPLPRLMRGMVEGFIQRENAKLIDGYLANLGKTLSGGNGRLR